MSNEFILIADSDLRSRKTLEDILTDQNYRVLTADTLLDAQALIRKFPIFLLLLHENLLKVEDSFLLVKEWNKTYQLMQTILVLEYQSKAELPQSITSKIFDTIHNPIITSTFLTTVRRALKAYTINKGNFDHSKLIGGIPFLAGTSQAMNKLRDNINKLASMDSWIMIMGECGSGKESVAKAIHDHRPIPTRDFIKLNLSIKPSENITRLLLGSEAPDIEFKGYFEQAREGTLFLDKINDLNLSTQSILINTIETYISEQKSTYDNLDFRIISTTENNLNKALTEGLFRKDLYYRLSSAILRVPPLRERLEDIPILVDYIMGMLIDQHGIKQRHFSRSALDSLRNHYWPGNLLELKNFIHYLLTSDDQNEISKKEVEDGLKPLLPDNYDAFLDRHFKLPLRDARNNFEKAYLSYHINNMQGTVKDLAKKIGVERTYIYRKLKTFNIKPI